MAKCTVEFEHSIGDRVRLFSKGTTLTVEGQRNVDDGHAFYCIWPDGAGVWIEAKALHSWTEEHGDS